MFHLCAYTGLISTIPLTDIAALSDDIVPISNNHFLPYRDYDLIAAAVMSPTLSRAQLNSGTIRQVNPTYIRPPIVGAVPPNNSNIMVLADNPFRVHGQEELILLATSAIAMGNEQLTALIWLQTQPVPAPIGNIYLVRYTSTTACVANKWTTIAYTLETGLPAGRYAVVDITHQSANAQAARIIFDNQQERPGNLAIQALGNRKPYIVDNGDFGLMGYFFTYSLPRIQVLANAADATHEGYLHIVKVG